MAPSIGIPELAWLAQTRHVLDRHLDPELERLAVPRIDDPYWARTVGAEASEESRDLGLLNVNIHLSPVKPAEFVVLQFAQKMQSE